MTTSQAISIHRERRNRDGFSVWFIAINGRKRKIELQEFRGRLYLVGCLYSRHSRVLEFECTLRDIIRRFGKVIPRDVCK